MSVPLMIASHLTSHVVDAVQYVAAASPSPSSGTSGIPNPSPAAPAGVADKASTIIGFVKWGVLVVIIIAGFISAAALVAGRITGNHRSSQSGVGLLISTVIAAVVYAVIYGVVTQMAS